MASARSTIRRRVHEAMHAHNTRLEALRAHHQEVVAAELRRREAEAGAKLLEEQRQAGVTQSGEH